MTYIQKLPEKGTKFMERKKLVVIDADRTFLYWPRTGVERIELV
jgi:hypothetical protein